MAELVWERSHLDLGSIGNHRRGRVVQGGMERRTLLTLLLTAPAAAVVAACGSDDAAAPAQTGDPLPPATDPTAVPTTLPAPDEPVSTVLEFGYYGGFTTREVAFQQQPQVLITSDGRLITPAPTIAIYPGPLVSPSNVQTITQDGIDTLLDAARDAGLFADVTYPENSNVADAATATLRIRVDGTTYVHEAYALGIDASLDELEADRPGAAQGLDEFVELLGDIPALVGPDELGPVEPYRPDAYQLSAVPAGDLSGYELEPTVIEWPAGTGVRLADAADDAVTCLEADADQVGDLLENADQLTFFNEDDITYQVLARPAYPDRSC